MMLALLMAAVAGGSAFGTALAGRGIAHAAPAESARAALLASVAVIGAFGVLAAMGVGWARLGLPTAVAVCVGDWAGGVLRDRRGRLGAARASGGGRA